MDRIGKEKARRKREDVLNAKGLKTLRRDKHSTMMDDHHKPTRRFSYPVNDLIIPDDLAKLEYTKKPILGRETLCFLTQGKIWRKMSGDMARRLLDIFTPYQCEMALLQHGATTWENVGNSLLDLCVPRMLLSEWPLPAVVVGDRTDSKRLTETTQALVRVESRWLKWQTEPVSGKTTFRDYANSPSAASHRIPYYGHITTACPLTELPAEIRTRIFSFCMPAPGRTVLFPPRSQDDAGLPAAGARYAQEPGLLLANKQIRAETAAMFYHDREVFIPVMPLVGPNITIFNALSHVTDILPLVGNCTIFGHFAWSSSIQNSRRRSSDDPPWFTAIAAVHIIGRDFKVKIYLEQDSVAPADYAEFTTNGVENLVEAVEMAMPFHLKRQGSVDYETTVCNEDAFAVFNDSHCLLGPWMKKVVRKDRRARNKTDLIWVDGYEK